MVLDVEDWIELGLMGPSLLLTAFASAAEAAVVSANHFRIKRLAAEGGVRARLVDPSVDENGVQ